MTLTGRKILRYMTLPEIAPRFRDLLGSGFGFIAFSMACVLQNCRLLPQQHAYCNATNIGKFGIGHVLGQAALNLKFSSKHIDQILIFGLLLVGCVLLIMQLGMIGFSLFTQVAHAGGPLPTTFAGWFLRPAGVATEQDISYMIFDRIFGIPGIFNSCVSLGQPCVNQPANTEPFPFPYHAPMRAMLAFYSQGLLWVAAIILAYHIITLVSEMTQTGTFFGRRFNRIWGPLRMVAAIGLLLPMSNDLNAAQYISLYVAKWGSGFASNAWGLYVAQIADPSTLMGPPESLVAKPKPASSNDLIQFMAMAKTCQIAYQQLYSNKVIQAYAVRRGNIAPNAIDLNEMLLNYSGLFPDYHAVQEWFGFGDVDIVFGEHGTGQEFERYKGGVVPYCGQIVIPFTHLAIANGSSIPDDGLDIMPFWYTDDIRFAWYENDPTLYSIQPIAELIVDAMLHGKNYTATPYPPDPVEIQEIVQGYDDFREDMLANAYAAMTNAGAFAKYWQADATLHGWAGAGIWYNRIATVNGAFVGSVFNTPIIVKYPMISEMIQKERQNSNATVSGENRFDPNLGDLKKGEAMEKNTNDRDKQIAAALNDAYLLFSDMQERTQAPSTGNPFLDAINALFKKTGLWSLRENREVHPLAGMASLGKTLLTNSVIAFGAGAAAGIMGALGKKSMPQSLAKGFSSFLLSIAYVGVAAGVLLYYVVPLMPFIYFIFAVLGWAKVVFECMVGIPLWALAHLRYDGHGFPTAQSMYGYYLLVDLFIRPVLIVFGLIASITIFYALAKTLNNVFDIVVLNLSGFDNANTTTGPTAWTDATMYKRGPIDQLAFLIIYAVVIYMMALSAFKMIDAFPNNVMRWMGSGSQGFGSRTGEDAGQTVAGGLQQGSSQLSMSMNSAVGGFGEAADAAKQPPTGGGGV